ncbi:methyltransferase domain-containing protein [Solimonas sp. K1W22B-7]|uniref:methyltransferase domain-containing protein n=1 Tax=Solimonas sp. K1W22B-7 TaxID=2303331 RepID=UPI000E331CC5|nr:methyltransferase domain-containing protein [Solimonas sp. K1W22B-7]AXQ29001.1 methyltransferase domain-containing protein [Solimonas sp. K1W22B-7]
MQPDPHAQEGVWTRHSGQWQRIGSPLKPLPEDARRALSLVQPALAEAGLPSKVLVLGVTQELVQLPWPAGGRLLAVDHSGPMIASLWRPSTAVSSEVLRARWQELPLPDASVTAIVGDGSLNALPSLAGIPAVLSEARRVLRPAGLMALRCFIRPDRQESLEAVRDAALQGQVGSFHALKWRVAMALPADAGFSVAVTDILASFEQLFPDRDELARRAGWPRESTDTIEAYRGTDTRYCFPTLAALAEVAAPHFSIVEQRCGEYELAERCPTLCFRPLPESA